VAVRIHAFLTSTLYKLNDETDLQCLSWESKNDLRASSQAHYYLLVWKSADEGNLPLPSAASVSPLSWGSSRPTSKRVLLSPLCTILAVVTMFSAELRGAPWIVTFKILDRRNVDKVFQTSDPELLCKMLRSRKALIITFSCNTGWNVFMHSIKESKERFSVQIYWIHNIALSSNKINILTRYYFLCYCAWEI
jgi:hypothetical protein